MDNLSASQINLYRQCSLKYRFQYVNDIPKPFQPSGLAFGSVIHSANEWLHKQKISGKSPSLKELLKILEVDWFAKKLDMPVLYKDGEAEEKLLLKAREILCLYYHDPPVRAKATEIAFKVPLVNVSNGEKLDVSLEGVIDLLAEDDVIVEIKTGARAMDKETLESHLQLTADGYAFWMLHQREPKKFMLVNLLKTKNPKVEILKASRRKEDYEKFFHTARNVLKGIRSGVFFLNPSFMCKDCEYEDQCRRWQGN